MTKQQLTALLRMTVSDPKEGANLVLSYAPTRSQLFEMVVLVVIGSVILVGITGLIVPYDVDIWPGQVINQPLILTGVQIAGMYLMGAAVYYIGRMCGGKGSFDEGLLLLIWLQLFMFLAQFLQVFALVFLPFMELPVVMASMVLSVWLFVSFVAVLHGFKSRLKVLFGSIASLFGIAIGISFLLASLGIGA